ncbi:MAG: putative rane protein [Clostridiales bacterium]|jgi:diadenylate cyclase|nr:putative rane protein [Clostridiales bacterium]
MPEVFSWDNVANLLQFPRVKIGDIVEIFIIAIIIYQVIKWIKDTRAWMLFKGIIVLFAVALLASIFQLSTILWIFSNTINVGIIALIIVFQPELRRALEQLGRKNIISSLIPFDEQRDKTEKFSDFTVSEIVKAVEELSRTKTGALIVIERDVMLSEYENTGIPVDAIVTSQLLINIFEHNTPLHDGAIIIRSNRILSATCYLPLSDNMRISKDLGTRHRAGLGISEVTDSLTIIVSEETGKTSISFDGRLERGIDFETLRRRLIAIQNKSTENKKFKLWKGRLKNEKVTHK